MWRSVPHTPACRTAISTSPGPAVGLETLLTARPGAGFSLTIARITNGDEGTTGRGPWVRHRRGRARGQAAHEGEKRAGPARKPAPWCVSGGVLPAGAGVDGRRRPARRRTNSTPRSWSGGEAAAPRAG